MGSRLLMMENIPSIKSSWKGPFFLSAICFFVKSWFLWIRSVELVEYVALRNHIIGQVMPVRQDLETVIILTLIILIVCLVRLANTVLNLREKIVNFVSPENFSRAEE